MFQSRYRVEICHANYRPERNGYPLCIAHEFTSRVRAEQFARAIANKLPRVLSHDGCPLSWVLVHALAASEAQRVSTGETCCYLSLDPGGIVVKHHDIARGYHGAKCAKCDSDLSRIAS